MHCSPSRPGFSIDTAIKLVLAVLVLLHMQFCTKTMRRIKDYNHWPQQCSVIGKIYKKSQLNYLKEKNWKNVWRWPSAMLSTAFFFDIPRGALNNTRHAASTKTPSASIIRCGAGWRWKCSENGCWRVSKRQPRTIIVSPRSMTLFQGINSSCTLWIGKTGLCRWYLWPTQGRKLKLLCFQLLLWAEYVHKAITRYSGGTLVIMHLSWSGLRY